MSTGTAKLAISAVEEEAKKEAQQYYMLQEKEYQEEEQYSEDLSYVGSKGNGKGKGKGIKGNCWNCDKPGHRAADCKSKGKGNGQEKGLGKANGQWQRGYQYTPKGRMYGKATRKGKSYTA